jgi:hypothetical protein
MFVPVSHEFLQHITISEEQQNVWHEPTNHSAQGKRPAG